MAFPIMATYIAVEKQSIDKLIGLGRFSFKRRLTGLTESDRSRRKDQTKHITMALQVGGWAQSLGLGSTALRKAQTFFEGEYLKDNNLLKFTLILVLLRIIREKI